MEGLGEVVGEWTENFRDYRWEEALTAGGLPVQA
jgi:hypothetical protein